MSPLWGWWPSGLSLLFFTPFGRAGRRSPRDARSPIRNVDGSVTSETAASPGEGAGSKESAAGDDVFRMQVEC